MTTQEKVVGMVQEGRGVGGKPLGFLKRVSELLSLQQGDPSSKVQENWLTGAITGSFDKHLVMLRKICICQHSSPQYGLDFNRKSRQTHGFSGNCNPIVERAWSCPWIWTI